MFGHESKPSRIWTYGCRAPHVNADLANQQFWLAHRYRNKLVEIELERRRETNEALLSINTELAGMASEIESLEKEVESARADIKRQNAKSKRKSATKEQSAAVKEMRATLKERRALYRAARKAAFAHPDTKAALSVIDERSNLARKTARKECGLYWGTYLAVEQSLSGIRSGRPPKFKRFTGDGRLCVQIQGGLSIGELMAGKDTRVRVEQIDDRKKPRANVWLRIGSDESGKPVWTCVRAVLHRPLPPGSQVKWVWLTRRRIATTHEYSIQFTVSCDSALDFAKPSAVGGMAGVDLGWRKLKHGIRVASWVGDDGQKGELVVPDSIVQRWHKSDDLKSIRDLHFNDCILALGNWLKTSDCKKPDWLIEATRTMSQWRSQNRLAALVIRWRNERFYGDAEMFAIVEAWRQKDKHLYEWERHNVAKAQRQRLDLYRCFAADMRKRYRLLAVEDCNWRDLMRHKAPEENDPENKAARYQQRVASVGMLARVLSEAVGEIARVSAVNTTMTCHHCGSLEKFDSAVEVYHVCENCGAGWDQDENAARNLLAAASGDIMREAGAALA